MFGTRPLFSDYKSICSVVPSRKTATIALAKTNCTFQRSQKLKIVKAILVDHPSMFTDALCIKNTSIACCIAHVQFYNVGVAPPPPTVYGPAWCISMPAQPLVSSLCALPVFYTEITPTLIACYTAAVGGMGLILKRQFCLENSKMVVLSRNYAHSSRN